MWIRTCTNPDNNPGCLKLINYKTTIGLNNGNRINSVCHSCRNYKPKNHIRFIRICFRCGNEINYGGIYAYKNAEKNETLCNKCTFHEKLAKNLHSKDVAKKISDSLKGNKPWNTGLKGVQVPWNRSEEHTSELQSQSNLV